MRNQLRPCNLPPQFRRRPVTVTLAVPPRTHAQPVRCHLTRQGDLHRALAADALYWTRGLGAPLTHRMG